MSTKKGSNYVIGRGKLFEAKILKLEPWQYAINDMIASNKKSFWKRLVSKYVEKLALKVGLALDYEKCAAPHNKGYRTVGKYMPCDGQVEITIGDAK